MAWEARRSRFWGHDIILTGIVFGFHHPRKTAPREKTWESGHGKITRQVKLTSRCEINFHKMGEMGQKLRKANENLKSLLRLLRKNTLQIFIRFS